MIYRPKLLLGAFCHTSRFHLRQCLVSTDTYIKAPRCPLDVNHFIGLTMRTFLTNLACPSRGKVTPMKPSTVAPLPVELIAMIMGFLQHDSRALGKCSLVCKTWFSLARHKLFRYIQVPYFAASGKKGFKPFIKFLQQSPNVRPLIKNLTLKAYSMRRLRMVSHRWWLPRRRPAILDPCTLLTICSMLPGLLTLKLDLLQWDEQWTTGKCWGRKAITPPRAGQVVSSLKELSISAMYAPHLDFLRYFSSIQHLRLSKVSGADVSSSPSTVSISAISMEHILKMESWISLFSRSGVEDSCQSLAISLLDLRSFIPSCPRSALAKWLDVGGMGSRLRHLTLQLDFVSAAACTSSSPPSWHVC